MLPAATSQFLYGAFQAGYIQQQLVQHFALSLLKIYDGAPHMFTILFSLPFLHYWVAIVQDATILRRVLPQEDFQIPS